MTTKFEELHPDTAECIVVRNYTTTRVEYYNDSKLKEVWEKVDGEWVDVSERELNKIKMQEKLAKARRELMLLRRQIEKQQRIIEGEDND